MSYVVKWGRERLHFPLPPPNAKLREVRKQIADYTQLPEDSFKLVHAGAVMKDDNAPISAYGIKDGSKLAVIGGGDHTVPEPPSTKIPILSPSDSRRTEKGTISQIRSEIDNVRQTLKPDVDKFLSALQQPLSKTETEEERERERLHEQLLKVAALTRLASAGESKKRRERAPSHSHPATTTSNTTTSTTTATAPSSAQSKPDLEREHIRLGELLLQSLLRLDAINAEGEWEDARRERKGAVREVQGLLDSVDGAWKAARKGLRA